MARWTARILEETSLQVPSNVCVGEETERGMHGFEQRLKKFSFLRHHIVFLTLKNLHRLPLII